MTHFFSKFLQRNANHCLLTPCRNIW